MKLSIVIPAYNEAGRIEETLEAYVQAFPEAEFVVVPNGCTDRTLEIVEAFRQRSLHRIIVTALDVPGKGRAVREGFRRASGELIGFVDADGATSPREFLRLVDVARDVDGAIASRWAAGAVVKNRSSIRRWVSKGFQLIVRLLFWMPFQDTQCGAKVFRSSVIRNLLPDLRIMNMTFDVELLALAYQRGFHIREVPTEWIDQSRSAVLGSPWKLLRSSARMFATLVSLWFRIRVSPRNKSRKGSNSPSI